jgi:hypothetical protein
MMAAIVANTAALGCEYQGMPADYAANLVTANIVFVSVFAVEMALKLLAAGLRQYASSPFNVFDGAVAVLSIVDVVIAQVVASQDGSGTRVNWYSALRAFRLLRVLRLASGWASLRKLVQTLGRALPAAINTFVVLVVVLLIFALVGLQVFGPQYDVASGNVPRANFLTLWWSFVTVFQVSMRTRCRVACVVVVCPPAGPVPSAPRPPTTGCTPRRPCLHTFCTFVSQRRSRIMRTGTTSCTNTWK